MKDAKFVGTGIDFIADNQPPLRRRPSERERAPGEGHIKRRCAVYTRKSSEEGLDMEFNSLDAQRESCEAYIASQKAEGWILVPDRYDDGGFSGGNLERPALKRLLADIELGRIDIVVVYKIDRLSRSLMDFSKLVEVFDLHNVTFVSVTQSFNTTTSMGRLTLNILLSFAQFEREVIGERIRDKFAASRKKGIWMGGHAPLGYDIVNRKLIANQGEAELVRHVFERFIQLGSVTVLVRELRAEGRRNKQGKLFDKGHVYKLLNNRVYIGEAVHKGIGYPGEHVAIVEMDVFRKVQDILATNHRARAAATRNGHAALLKGLIFTEQGRAMTPHHTKKGSRLYRYYVSTDAIRGRLDSVEEGSLIRLPGDMVENAVLRELRRLLKAPEIQAEALKATRRQSPEIDQTCVADVLKRFDEVWPALFPAEQARVVRLLVEKVTLRPEGLAVDLRASGLGAIVQEMLTPDKKEKAA